MIQPLLASLALTPSIPAILSYLWSPEYCTRQVVPVPSAFAHTVPDAWNAPSILSCMANSDTVIPDQTLQDTCTN